MRTYRRRPQASKQPSSLFQEAHPEDRIVDDSLKMEFAIGFGTNLGGVLEKFFRVSAPVRFDTTRVLRHRVSFQADARHSKLLTLDESGAGSTERIQHATRGRDLETAKVLSDEMWRE